MQRQRLFRVTIAVGIALTAMLRAFPAETPPELPQELLALFQRLDQLEVPSITDAKYVTLDFRWTSPFGRDFDRSFNAWLLAEDDETITVLEDDLRPKTYNRNGPTKVPYNWAPNMVTLIGIREADFESELTRLSVPEEREPAGFSKTGEPVSPSEFQFRNRPATRCLIAYAAWKKGLTSYCVPVVHGDWFYVYRGAGEYPERVWNDLAWRHFERAVNLLMFADRKDVITHLKLSIAISPPADFGEDRQKLLEDLEGMSPSEREFRLTATLSPKVLPPVVAALIYASRLKDVRCVQSGQPGQIVPYESDWKSVDADLATSQLLNLGSAAIPAMILALYDDTPTRTVFHWRDFAHDRKVLRVSDLAADVLPHVVLRDLGLLLVVLILAWVFHAVRGTIRILRRQRLQSPPPLPAS